MLRIAGLLALGIAFITTLMFAAISHAAPNTTKTINFQGRLLKSTGAVVADGHYNLQFKIYQGGSGSAAGNPGGTLAWTESHINNGGTGGVEVKNGYFSVALGSVNPFGTSVDWNSDTIWLSMNVAGSSASCTEFGTAPCEDDGEMLPMRRVTATPYAINSGQLGGKTADDFVQLGQGMQTDDSNGSSIGINKTGSGNLIQLQASGNDAFVVNNAGSVTLGSASDQSISVGTAASGEGKDLTVSAGAAADGSDLGGGDLVLQGGAGDGSGTSGDVIVKANGSDSTGTFQVQNAAGETVLGVDTENTKVSVGTLELSSDMGVAPEDEASLWSNAPTGGSAFNDNEGVNLGIMFTSDREGYITGVKYYNPGGGNQNGNDVGKLWSCNSADCALDSGGSELATVTFPADTTAGWKTASFSEPVHISPNTDYVVTYFTQNGIYHATSGYFNADYSNGPLHVPGGSISKNGRFALNSNPIFPNDSLNATNYWVDVVFQASTAMDHIGTDSGLSITSGGPMSIGPSSHSLSLQGSEIDITASKGGDVTIQGGNAEVSDGNGGSVILSGGAGNGSGAAGLVVMTTPTFSTATNDANCYTGGSTVAASCTITKATVDGSSAVVVGFSTTDRTATLPDPTITTAGRIIYVMAAGGTEDFTLRANVGGGAEQNITMRKNTTATMIWNGDDWTPAGGSSATTLQDAYTNTPQSAAGNDIVLDDTTGGLTVRDNATTPVNDSLLDVKNSTGNNLFSVNGKVTTGTELATDGIVHDDTNFATNWTQAGSATVSRITSDGQENSDSAQVVAGTSAGNGIRNALSSNPATESSYRVSVYAKLASGDAFSDFTVRYSPDGGSSFVDCTNYSTQTVTTTGWTQITCSIATGGTAVTDPYVYLVQGSASGGRTFLVDTLSFTLASNSTPNVKVGSGTGTDTTLFTLDKSASAPTADSNDALLGSMYYDTDLGKVQCYEEDGWGTCGAAPDTFVTISPEYTNAVMNGNDVGTITSDLCSDTLNINDGSSAQPTICGTNETYNFYQWTTEETTDQTRSIFVTYQLPADFKNFIAGSTSLAGRTDSSDAAVSYQIYRDDGSGLTSCGTVSVSSGTQSSWQKAQAIGGADPSNCGFEAGDSILFRINLTSKNDANAYVSNLGFTFSNN